MLERHFVTFYSPGTFFHEETTRAIDSWNIEAALEMVQDIRERYGATPFAFCFSTRQRAEEELDSKVVRRSGRYYLGGIVLTLDEIKARNGPEDAILISNMESNGWERVIENRNSWKVTQPLKADDAVLEFAPIT